MAVRVKLRIARDPRHVVVTAAVLNGGFEIPEPHLLLPAACARRLFGDFRRGAARQEMSAAGGPAQFFVLRRMVRVRAFAAGHEGPENRFHILVSEGYSEVLVSDGGIDALRLRIESFNPGRWRFADETRIRETEAPQIW